jgi:hypothetical protein
MKHPTGLAAPFAALLVLAAPFGSAAGQTVAENKEPIVLPDITVTSSAELPPLESWHYARVGGFEVLSNASAKSTRSLLADFALFTRALSLVWPAPLKPVASSTLILCGRGAKFDAFPPAGAVQGNAIVPSVFLRNREQIAIVIDVESDRVAIDPANLLVDGAGSTDYEVDHYKQLYREYVRYLLSQSQTRAPAWVEEGLAQIIMDIDLDDKRLIYGKIDSYRGMVSGGGAAGADDLDPSANADAVVGEQPFNVVLQHRKFMPFDRFFAVTANSPEARNPLGNNLWAKQAYAFVHFCMFGENLRYQQALTTFIGRLAREPVSEELFKECFKTDYKGMAYELRGYLLHTKHKYQRYEFKKDDQLTAKDIELREATPAEIALIKGDALRLGGHLDTALAAYRSGYLRGAREPSLLAGMGVTESYLNHTDRARELLELSVKAGVNRPSAHVELARLRLAAAGAGGAKLTVAQMGLVLTPLFEARKLPPPLPDTYELIATAWAQSAVAPKPDNLAVLDEGIRAFPRNSDLLYRAAQLYRQADALPVATSIAKLGLRYSSDDAAKVRFEELLAALPADSGAK